jgi:hypothetical protein
MSRPQKQCIFCDNPANSKEHFWPEWMHELLPQLPDPRHNRKIHEYHPKVGHTESGVEHRPGGVHTIKLRVLCNDCNTVWGRGLEEEVRPLLTPLIEGTPVALDHSQMAVIARWITLKCILGEHASPNRSMTPEADRFAFRKNGTIPEYFRIYVINHNVTHGIGFKRHSLGLSLTGPPSDPPEWGTPKNVQTISFLLGRILVHLNASRIENYTIESRYRTVPINVWDCCRIWPFQHHEMVWPRRPLLDLGGIESVSGALEIALSGATIHWGNDPNPVG